MIINNFKIFKKISGKTLHQETFKAATTKFLSEILNKLYSFWIFMTSGERQAL